MPPKHIAILLLLPMFWVTQAAATVITYKYKGNPYDYVETDLQFYFDDAEARDFILDAQPASMAATFTIDKSLLPGNSLSQINYSLATCSGDHGALSVVLCPESAVTAIRMDDGVGNSLSVSQVNGITSDIILNFSTNAKGQIKSWNLGLLDDGPDLRSSSEFILGAFSKGDESDPFRTGSFGPCPGQLCSSVPGEWAKVPEPTAWLLFIAGLLAIFSVRRRTLRC